MQRKQRGSSTYPSFVTFVQSLNYVTLFNYRSFRVPLIMRLRVVFSLHRTLPKITETYYDTSIRRGSPFFSTSISRTVQLLHVRLDWRNFYEKTWECGVSLINIGFNGLMEWNELKVWFLHLIIKIKVSFLKI